MKRKIFIITILLLLVLGSGLYIWRTKKQYFPEMVPVEIDISAFQLPTTSPSSLPTSHFEFRTFSPSPLSSQLSAPFDSTQGRLSSPSSVPTELNLKMSFYSQAPFGNWSLPWQEACEEASALLVANMYQKKNWNIDEFNQQILRIVEWEKGHFGAYEHTSVAQTVEMLDQYLGLKSVVHENPTFEDIKKVLAKGHFVIMPLAGRKLGNPFYTNGGPVYHMLVVKGYKDGKIITHDVGTRRGANYVFTWEIIDNALHDYAEPIEQGDARIIEVLPPQ
ncbi:MAG: C39 family peptidase [Candidatus Abawacabacteria bacterium]|nr:C39 family peptidase [Candidatus Abawacabacteria bacterium]